MMKSDLDMEVRYWNALRTGDSSSLAWIYNRYFKLLYNYGRKINASEKSVEDAIHDLFVDLWRLRASLGNTTSVKFYLYRSLRRRLARSQSLKDLFLSRDFDGDDPAISVPSREQDLIEQETHDVRVHRLRTFLNDLSPRQYEAMVLRFYDELSFEEIGAILQVNEQSARNLIQRGLAQIKRYSKLLFSMAFITSAFFRSA